MTTLVASAPGKLVLSGEYAVLDGAPAVAIALEPRAEVRMEPSDDWSVVAPGFDDRRRTFRISRDDIRWASAASPVPLLDAVWHRLRLADTPRPAAITLDTTAFSDDGGKLGLGSSAALAVALSGALIRWTTRNDGNDRNDGVQEAALAAHRELQRGKGSGVDVATAFHGGLVSFSVRKRALDPRTSSLSWPDGLFARILYSGVPVSTAAKLELLDERRHDPLQDRAHDPSRQALAEAATAAEAAWASGRRSAVLAATERFSVALSSFSDAYRLGVFAGGHAAARDLAEREGLVYKPSGAGGGDVGVVLGERPEQLDAFTRDAMTIGFRHLPANFNETVCTGFTAAWMHD